MKTQVQLIDAKNAGPKKIYLEFLPGYHCKKAQESYDQDVTDKCTFNIMVLFYKMYNLMK